MDLIFDFDIETPEEEFGDSKKDVLKFLKMIGVDTRFVSYTPEKLYINNLRFSKFSRKREVKFINQFPEIEVVRSSLFQKICAKSSKELSHNLEPKSKLLLSKDKSSLNDLIAIILEPYTRKYGIELVYEGEYDFIADSTILDDEVEYIFSEIFQGKGLNFSKDDNRIYPLIKVKKEWINSFLEMNNQKSLEEKENKNEYLKLADSFMEFLEDVSPQFRENVLVARDYIEKNLEVEK